MTQKERQYAFDVAERLNMSMSELFRRVFLSNDLDLRQKIDPNNVALKYKDYWRENKGLSVHPWFFIDNSPKQIGEGEEEAEGEEGETEDGR